MPTSTSRGSVDPAPDEVTSVSRCIDRRHRRHATCRWALRVAGLGGWFALVLAHIAAVHATDVVHLGGEGPRDGEVRLSGIVLDYTGEELRIDLGGGRVMRYPAQRVLRIERGRTAAEAHGDQAAAEHRYADARGAYETAMASEPRAWVQRQLLAKLVRTTDQAGHAEIAGRRFLELVAADPQTPDFACIPLAWLPAPAGRDLETVALAWLTVRDNPAARLLGASHLLNGRYAAAALAELRRLEVHHDVRIACLAQSQAWRTTFADATDNQLAHWAEAIDRYPLALRAGPYFVLGRAFAQRHEPERAALALLRVPLHYPEQAALAARALLEAGDALERLGQGREAATLYAELIEVYPHSEAAAGIRSRVRLDQ